MQPDQTSTICTTCHQPLLPSYYFCPNCGTAVHEKPLATNTPTQVWIYTFSIILPFIAFLFITRWPAMKYIRSQDPKAKQIGQIAWVLLILSTIVTIWLAFHWTQEAIKSNVESINADLSAF